MFASLHIYLHQGVFDENLGDPIVLNMVQIDKWRRYILPTAIAGFFSQKNNFEVFCMLNKIYMTV